MRKIIAIVLLVSLSHGLGLSGDLSGDASVESIEVLRISPSDQRAVVKLPDGTMQVIRVGDLIGERAKVVEIVRDRVVIEENTGQGVETIIIRLEDGKQKIEKMRRTMEKQPVIHAPQ